MYIAFWKQVSLYACSILTFLPRHLLPMKDCTALRQASETAAALTWGAMLALLIFPSSVHCAMPSTFNDKLELFFFSLPLFLSKREGQDGARWLFLLRYVLTQLVGYQLPTCNTVHGVDVIASTHASGLQSTDNWLQGWVKITRISNEGK